MQYPLQLPAFPCRYRDKRFIFCKPYCYRRWVKYTCAVHAKQQAFVCRGILHYLYVGSIPNILVPARLLGKGLHYLPVIICFKFIAILTEIHSLWIFLCVQFDFTINLFFKSLDHVKYKCALVCRLLTKNRKHFGLLSV